MEFKIIWKGNEHTNKSTRGKYAPFVIVNHISGGSMRSMDNWFTSPTNKVSSAHFGISKEGVIHQYVKIEDIAWHAGLKTETIKNATAKVVKDIGVNPNQYTIGIEHEGYDGNLTPIQLQASIWLHKYIKKYIKTKYNKDMKLDKYHVIGHFQVDPVRKPYCPGPKFPWSKLYEEIIKEVIAPKPTASKPVSQPKVESKPSTVPTTNNQPKVVEKPKTKVDIKEKPKAKPITQNKPKNSTTKTTKKETPPAPKKDKKVVETTKPKSSTTKNTSKKTTTTKKTNNSSNTKK